MKTFKNIIVVFCSFLLLSASCKKEKSKNPVDDLPLATQIGANTFGCLVNGESFIAKEKPYGNSSLIKDLYFNNGTYTLQVGGSSSNSTSVTFIKIFIENILIKSNTEYTLNNETTSVGEWQIISNGINSYKTKGNSVGILKITFYDPTKNILSGTFSFYAVNANGEKVEIREGRFDLQ